MSQAVIRFLRGANPPKVKPSLFEDLRAVSFGGLIHNPNRLLADGLAERIGGQLQLTTIGARTMRYLRLAQ